MINSIIFSKHRACQLDLLLESIFKNADNVFNLNVIYTYSNDNFKLGYEKLISRYSEKGINFYLQTANFKQDVIKLLDNEYEFSCFFTDDDIIYNKIESEKDILDLFSDDDLFCF